MKLQVVAYVSKELQKPESTLTSETLAEVTACIVVSDTYFVFFARIASFAGALIKQNIKQRLRFCITENSCKLQLLALQN